MLDQAIDQLRENFVAFKDYTSEQKHVNQKLDEYNTKLNNNFYSIEGNRRSIREFDSKLDLKADMGEFQILVEKVRNMPRNEDLVDLYTKVVPQMQTYEKVMNRYENEHNKFKKMIMRFDEDIA